MDVAGHPRFAACEPHGGIDRFIRTWTCHAPPSIASTPEEGVPPDVVRRVNELASSLRSSEPRSRLWDELLIGSTFSMQHREMLPEVALRRFGQVNIDLVIGFAKLDQCATIGDAFQILSRKELRELLGNREAFDRLKALRRHGQPNRSRADDRMTTMPAIHVTDLTSDQ